MSIGSKVSAARPAPNVGGRSSQRPLEWVSLAIGVALTSALILGWKFREELPWTAEHGLGYWLGIAGLSCVGLLLLYPLRKRAPALAVFGTVPTWFRIHMFLGALAPVLILFHARFSVSSANANVALTCMLIVAGSGVIGRFLYVRIYRGVAGRKQEARRLLAEAEVYRSRLNEHFAAAVDYAQELEDVIGAKHRGFFSTLFHAIAESQRISNTQSQMIRAIRQGSRMLPGSRREQKREQLEAVRLARSYCETLRAVAQLSVFERLFSLWHVVHLPLFFLMLLAAAIHVLAVHQY
ncbi:MAG: hypothetical protein R3C04_08725 [Hyphomonas sp.]